LTTWDERDDEEDAAGCILPSGGCKNGDFKSSRRSSSSYYGEVCGLLSMKAHRLMIVFKRIRKEPGSLEVSTAPLIGDWGLRIEQLRT